MAEDSRDATEQMNCTFCGISRENTKKLIQSPDKSSHICEECTLQPTRLKTILLESLGTDNSEPSGVFGFLRRGQSKGVLKCSFCEKRVGLSDLYRSTLERATKAQICSECLDICRQILRQDTGIHPGKDTDDAKPVRIRADFNGLFGELLCISHSESCPDELGTPVSLRAGMKLTAYDEDVDDDGNRDDLVASGTVEPAPSWLRCNGSRWVLKIDAKGVRHQSEIGNQASNA